jgi:uroporphyrinogen-III decarboxylase
MYSNWEHFKQAAKLEKPKKIPIALIVDSPWLPGYSEIDIAEAKQKIGHRAALMGNVPPLDIGVRGTPEEVAQWTKDCLGKVGNQGRLIVSIGGGVSPNTPPESIDALVNAVDD